ncbi:hypothetical protein DAMA08_006390 [Martiniozyma asiatica (nom. inval.)]|nr:hypothetical protein DAMA08_006390 [Martiniozyma asiatica]
MGSTTRQSIQEEIELEFNKINKDSLHPLIDSSSINIPSNKFLIPSESGLQMEPLANKYTHRSESDFPLLAAHAQLRYQRAKSAKIAIDAEVIKTMAHLQNVYVDQVNDFIDNQINQSRHQLKSLRSNRISERKDQQLIEQYLIERRKDKVNQLIEGSLLKYFEIDDSSKR